MYDYEPAYENQFPPFPCDSCKEEVCKRRYGAEGWCAE